MKALYICQAQNAADANVTLLCRYFAFVLDEYDNITGDKSANGILSDVGGLFTTCL